MKPRPALLSLVVALVVGSIAWFWTTQARAESFLMAVFLILAWVPIKGMVYDRFRLPRPYLAALIANVASELIGLNFSLGFGFWSLMFISMTASALIDALTIYAVGLCPRLREALVVAGYASLVVHLITAGFFWWRRSVAQSVVLIIVGFVVSHPPSLLTEPISDSMRRDPVSAS